MTGNKRYVKMNKGFTLVEMLVVVLIFSIIVGVATGVFASAIKIQRYNLVHHQLLNQVGYAMEYISRAMRMAQKDDGTCGFSGQNYRVSDSNRKIEFRNYLGEECQEFYWDTATNQLMADRTGYAAPVALTSNDFEITVFNFNLTGQSDSDYLQPRVTLFIELQGKGSGYQPLVRIQTTISQRNLDI